jgi:hypothetical protein
VLFAAVNEVEPNRRLALLLKFLIVFASVERTFDELITIGKYIEAAKRLTENPEARRALNEAKQRALFRMSDMLQEGKTKGDLLTHGGNRQYQALGPDACLADPKLGPATCGSRRKTAAIISRWTERADALTAVDLGRRFLSSSPPLLPPLVLTQSPV